jgi:16S rRNA pseudouridine516 synthase
MKLLKYIANLGYGTRRDVARLFVERRVTNRAGRPLDEQSSYAHDDILIDGQPLDVAPGALILLHKPVGYVCSTADTNPVVYDLLPARFRARSPVVAAVGRLDRDTSGLLLLTDDGQLNHRITSPRVALPKVYEATLATDLRGDEGEHFASGMMMLDGESTPLEPAALDVLSARRARVALAEGRYHQVRRMFAAVGNHVDALHRISIGSLTLGELSPGEWRTASAAELEQLRLELATSRRGASPREP